MPGRLKMQLGRRIAAVRAVAIPAAEAGMPAEAGLGQGDFQERLEAEREALEQARQALLDGVDKLRRRQDELLAEAEAQLLDLAVDIARKILVQEIQAGRYEIEPIVKDALARAPTHQDVVVYLHPDDWSRCGLTEGTHDASGPAQVRFVADPGVRRAECVIETPEGIVESAAENQLSEIAEALKVVE